MSDEIDDANEELQKQLDATLSTVNTEVPDNETGQCIWCETKVKDIRRWCSVECRNEHEHYARKI
jgi:hypothetical protein|tara:strand:+ start:1355 stop:1549 length:195 start_codon:yes stop_codon:yes gene_type:complete